MCRAFSARPTGPGPEEPEGTGEPNLTTAESDARLLVSGDATFIRDDFLSGLYHQRDSSHRRPIFGPHSRNPNAAVLFLKSLLDWMAQEYDLQALQFKHRTDRLMKFAEQEVAQQETFDEFRERIIVRSRWIRYANSLVPAFLLLLGGILVWFTRRAQNRAFLAGL